ncbi:SPOSA6832_00588 [Sporobolomyces salmonicolor]|uniref:Elongation factor-like 1 n=1 Tax=Sporidiobolus salmonicolor TaxID=5005 RepID=A0A0D6EGC0_SPOSA|nr:SPOSA6832_00588 [Sporobolomyces salmonicolor]
MESSAVSLRWRIPSPAAPGEEPVLEDYKINLIDTPGHTITVLRTVYLSHLRPILVINKLDRLITEIKLSPIEAYHHLTRIIEDVNAVVGSFYSGERMEEDLHRRERQEAAGQADSPEEEFEERDDSTLYFDPAQGNVIFASAIDGWAFRISRFAQLYAAKLGISEANLNKVLWGDFFLDPKTKRVLNRKKMEASGKKLKPLFVQFVLENIWAAYDAVVLNKSVDKIIASLGVKVRPQDLRAKDTRNLLLSIFSQWLPLAPSAFRALVEKVPPPAQAQSFRIPRMLHPELGHLSDDIAPANKLEEDLYSGNAGDDAYCVAYVSKMFAVKVEDLPENQRKQITADDMRARAKAFKEAKERRARLLEQGRNADGVAASAVESGANGEAEEVEKEEEEELEKSAEQEKQDALIGFARLYSGTIALGQTLYAVLPKFNADLAPSHPQNAKHLAPIKVEQLYMMMGRELLAVKEVQAGNLFAIGGLEGIVPRNATLCGMGKGKDTKEGAERDEDRDCLVNLAGVTQTSAPIVRVALEPQDPSEMSKLVEGLRLLNQADPCVETLVQSTGEHVILTAGELHLEVSIGRSLPNEALVHFFLFTALPKGPAGPLRPHRDHRLAAHRTVPRDCYMAPPKTQGQPRGTVRGSVQSGLVTFTIRAVPLPADITNFLSVNMPTIKRLQRDRRSGKADEEADDVASDAVEGVELVKPEEFWPKLEALLKAAGRDWAGLADQIWAFGPRKIGANMLIDRTEGSPRSLRRRLERQATLPSALATPGSSALSPPKSPIVAPSDPALGREFAASEFSAGEIDMTQLKASLTEVDTSSEAMHKLPDLRELDENFDAAFQLAMNRGPLCAEPVIGMAYFFEQVELNAGEMDVPQSEPCPSCSPIQPPELTTTSSAVRSKWSNARGQLISAGQDAFRTGLLDWSPRLQLAMYSCDIQATGEVLGKVYGVVAKRKGRIVSEEMKEGTAFFTVSALLPVVESFGFADEIRTRTSGAASPQLVFYGYETLDQDPFWVPTTEEELEDLGEKADRENIAKKYMDAVRKRKGMAVERKVVMFAEKQKTMKSA